MKKMIALVLALVMMLSLLPMTVWAEGEPVYTGNGYFNWGVTVFTEEDNGVLKCADTVKGSQAGISVPFDAFVDTIYIATNDSPSLKTSAPEGAVTVKNNTAIWGEYNIHELKVTKPASGTATATLTGFGRDGTDEITFTFAPQQGGSDQGGGNDNSDSQRRIEYPFGQYSKVVVDVDPNVAKIVTFPDEINENKEIVLTVNKVDAELWRPLMDGQDQDFYVHYEIHPIVPEGKSNPKFASGSNMNDPGLNTFRDYEGAHERLYMDSVDFAWASVPDEEGVITIAPQADARSWAIRWQYGNDEPTDAETVTVKSVFANDVKPIKLAPLTYNPVAADRIDLVADYATKFEYLDTVLSFDEYTSSGFVYGTNTPGVLTYSYQLSNAQADPGELIYAAAYNDEDEDAVIIDPENGLICYDLLTVTAPEDGYVIEKLESPFFDTTYSDQNWDMVTLRYHWDGFGTEQKYVLTWTDSTGAGDDIVEQLIIAAPDMDGLAPWMSFVVDGETTARATAVPDERLNYTDLADSVDVAGVSEHTYNENTGVLFTTFDSTVKMDVDPVLDATFSIEKPANLENGASVSTYQLFVGYDGTADASYSKTRNKWKVEAFWEILLEREKQSISDVTKAERIGALKEQIYGEKKEIKYYYSANKGNRFVLIKWNYSDGSAKYEYMRLNTNSYFCQWEEVLKVDGSVTGEVDVPTATISGEANSNIKLVARIHPQKQEEGYGQYFFELDMVEEGEGNVYTEPGDTYFTIILPYSFMGEDWDFTRAKTLKEKPMITHFDKEFKKLSKDGEITGKYTERGIEFTVNSFSPFTVSWSAPTSKTYATKYGSSDPNNPVSTLTVELTELQAKVLTLPNEINDNNELIIKVHNAAQNNEDVWRKLMEEDDFGVHYYFNSVEEEGTAKPVVKSIGTDVTIEEAIDRMAAARFVDYNAPAGRDNGLDFAWATKETDRLFIIPTANAMTSAVVWRYAHGDGSYTDKEDGVIIKFVLDEDISNAVVIETEQISVVDSARVTVKNHDNLGKVFAGTYSGANGVLTYRYTGPATGAATDNTTAGSAIATAAEADSFVWETGENPSYPVLTVRAPDGYTLQSVACSECSDTIGTAGATSVELAYHWLGLGEEQTYTLTWVAVNSADRIVEQLTIETPAVAGATWMSHINETAGEEFSATPVPNANVRITQQGMDKTGIEVSYSNGLLWSEFKQDVMLDVDAVNGTTFSIKIPKNAVAYKITRCGDGSDNCTYTNNNTWMPADFQDMVDRESRIDLGGNETYIPEQGVRALLKQSIGNIQYYYSADRGTYLVLVKWIYDKNNENNGAKYEYIQYDTSPYYCRWKTSAVSPDDPSNSGENTTVVPVEKPTVAFDGNINLVTRIHPQNTHGQFFYELDVVDGDGNGYTETTEDGFLIILPYAFMGKDSNGQPWTKETAIASGKKAMITHYDDDFTVKKNNGTIEGEFTDRGIEFWVDSFSPFLLNWEGQSGGQQPEGGGNEEVVLFVNDKRLPYESVENVTYDSQTNTLTLNNANILGMDENLYGAGIFYNYNGSNPTYQTLTIELKGENTVTAGDGNDYWANAIHVERGNLLITEADGANGATLNAVSASEDVVPEGAVGILVMNGTLTIKGGTVKTYGGVGEFNSAGIFCAGSDCTIEGGEVNAYGRTSVVNSVGIFCPGGNLIVDGGTVKACGVEGAEASCGFAVSGECKILNDSIVVAEGKTASAISAGIFMMPVNDGVSNKVLIDDKASVTASGKDIAISANEVDIENGNYTLSVKTSPDGAWIPAPAEIEWAEVVGFKMEQPTQPSGGNPSGNTPGGYYPGVTPTTPSVDVDNSSLSNAAQAVGGAINSGSAEIKAENGYTKEDIAKLQKDGKLEMTIQKKSGYDVAAEKLIDAAIDKAGGAVSGTVVQYFDITVVLKHEDTGAVVATVSDTKKPISITVDLSSELQKAAKDGKYIYVVRCHEGKTDFLEATLNTDKTKVTFASAHFSTYAVVALDKAVETVSAEISAEKPATPPAQETVTPEPEDITPEVVPDEPPVIDDGAVDDAPAVDEPQGGSAGLWVGVGIVALAAIVVVLAVMVVRKKRKD